MSSPIYERLRALGFNRFNNVFETNFGLVLHAGLHQSEYAGLPVRQGFNAN